MRYQPVTTGIYGDRRGALHVDVPALLVRGQLPDNAFTRGWLARQAIRELRAEGIGGVIVARLGGMPAGVGRH